MKREDVVVCYYHRVLWARGFQERRHEISMQTVRQVAEKTQHCSNKAKCIPFYPNGSMTTSRRILVGQLFREK